LDSSVTLPEGYQIVDHTNLPEGYSLIQPPSMLESAGRGALNNFPLANQALSGMSGAIKTLSGSPDVPGYSASMADLSQKAQLAKAAHPVPYGIGAVGAAAAPLAIPGVGEVLEAAPIAGNAALGAAQGINDVDLSKNPGEGLKQAGIGALIGGTIGKAGEMLPDMGAIANKLENQNILNKAGVTSEMVEKMTPKGGVPQDISNELAAFLKNRADLAGSKEDMFSSLEKFRTEKAGPAVGKAINNIAKTGGSEAGDSTVWQPIGDLYTEYKGSPLPGQQRMANEIEPILNHLAERAKANGGAIKIEDIEPLLQGVGKAYAKTSPTNELHGIYGEIYGALSQARENIADQVAASTNNPGLKEALLKANRDYSLVAKLGPATKRQASKEALGQPTGQQGVGMLGRMFGGIPSTIRYPAAAALGGTGHLFGAASLMSPELMNKGVQAGALRVIKPTVKTTQQALIDYLISKYGDQNAQ
jgi:hypothetical protein